METAVLHHQSQQPQHQRGVQASSQSFYRFLAIPAAEASAANCLLINGTIVHRHTTEYPQAVQLYADLVKDPSSGVRAVRQLHMSEFEKADGALTCCSLLLS